MSKKIRMGIVADHDPKSRYHAATTHSILHAAEALSIPAEPVWIETDSLDREEGAAQLQDCDGIWCGPGSPYKSMEGALRAIRFARENDRPFIGT